MVHAKGRILKLRYRVSRTLARGSMSLVYEAADVDVFDRRVAVKECVVPSAALRSAVVHAFRNEARLMARVHHPGVPALHDFFHEAGAAHLVMELIEGKTLSQALPHVPYLDRAVALRWLRELASILAHIHASQPAIIFRDLQPDNVMLAADGRVRLVDFGIAWSSALAQSQPQRLGTEGYAPPEQHAGGSCTPRADVYALGAVAYRIFAGADPPSAAARPHTPLPSLLTLNPQVDGALDLLIRRMMAMAPDERPASAEAVLVELDRLAASAATPRAESPRAGASAADVTAAARRGDHAVILVADDDPGVLTLVKRVLELEGYSVVPVRDGPSAVQRVRACQPDLVILDWGMPLMSGLQASRVIRQSSDVPILMLTARADAAGVVLGLEHGADDYLAKPPDNEVLLARVRALLRRRPVALQESSTR